MEPLVSINCTTYNHAPYVRNALDGFLMQKTNFPFEVVLHDDASTDGTQDIIREYERNYPKLFNVIYQKENQYSKTQSFMEMGIKFIAPKIRGKYIASCEGDDYWIDPNKLQTQVNYMETHEDCSCTFHAVAYLSPSYNGEKVSGQMQPWFSEGDVPAEIIIRANAATIPTLSMMSRTSITNEWPKFRQMADVGDYPAKLLLAAHGDLHYFPNIMGVYRSGSNGSWSKKYTEDKFFRANHHLKALKWIYEYNLYTERRFADAIGKKLYLYILNSDKNDWNKVFDYSKFEEPVKQATEFSRNIEEGTKLAEEVGDETVKEQLEKAETDFWAGFAETIGQIVKE